MLWLTKNTIKNSIKGRQITTATATLIVLAMKAADAKTPKASLEILDITKLANGIFGRVLVKEYVVYKKLING